MRTTLGRAAAPPSRAGPWLAPSGPFRDRSGALPLRGAERIDARQIAEAVRDLAAAADAQLVAQGVAMRLGCSRGDAETYADLLVRASGGDQFDDLELPRGDLRPLACGDACH